jgi:hypothetical protein
MPEKCLAGSSICLKEIAFTSASVGIYRIMYASTQG